MVLALGARALHHGSGSIWIESTLRGGLRESRSMRDPD